MLIGMQDDFGITVGPEFMSRALQLRSDFTMIENFAVKDESNIAVCTDQRLVAVLKIENSESRGPN
jgi:hypothetical protein